MKISTTRKFRSVALAVGTLVGAGSANAQNFLAILRGTNEVPPNASTATGFATMSLLNVNTLRLHLEFTGLIGGPASAAHIHCCTAVGSNVGVAVGFGGFPAATNGVFDADFNLLDAAIYTPAYFNTFGNGTVVGARAALLNGLSTNLAYVNIHNSTFPGGEIRGQVAVVPEPATLALTGAGLLMLVVAARRRVRS